MRFDGIIAGNISNYFKFNLWLQDEPNNAVTIIKLELNTEKEGFMWYKDAEDVQRPRALYHINPDFRGI